MHLKNTNTVTPFAVDEKTFIKDFLALMLGVYLLTGALALTIGSTETGLGGFAFVLAALSGIVGALIVLDKFDVVFRQARRLWLVNRLFGALRTQLSALRSGRDKLLTQPNDGTVRVEVCGNVWNVAYFKPDNASPALRLMLVDGVLFDPHGVVKDTPDNRACIRLIANIVRHGTERQ